MSPPIDASSQAQRCGFRGKGSDRALKLIAGPTTLICGTCVYDGIRERLGNEVRESRRCSFCDQEASDPLRMRAVENHAICRECLALSAEILSEDLKGLRPISKDA